MQLLLGSARPVDRHRHRRGRRAVDHEAGPGGARQPRVARRHHHRAVRRIVRQGAHDRRRQRHRQLLRRVHLSLEQRGACGDVHQRDRVLQHAAARLGEALPPHAQRRLVGRVLRSLAVGVEHRHRAAGGAGAAQLGAERRHRMLQAGAVGSTDVEVVFDAAWESCHGIRPRQCGTLVSPCLTAIRSRAHACLKRQVQGWLLD